MEEVDFSCGAFWIQIHGLPLIHMNAHNANLLGSRLGKLLEVDNADATGMQYRKFLRVKVLINLQNPLAQGFNLPRIDKPLLRINFRYERLSDFCFTCGRLGPSLRAVNLAASTFELINKHNPPSPSNSTPSNLSTFPDIQVLALSSEETLTHSHRSSTLAAGSPFLKLSFPSSSAEYPLRKDPSFPVGLIPASGSASGQMSHLRHTSDIASPSCGNPSHSDTHVAGNPPSFKDPINAPQIDHTTSFFMPKFDLLDNPTRSLSSLTSSPDHPPGFGPFPIWAKSPPEIDRPIFLNSPISSNSQAHSPTMLKRPFAPPIKKFSKTNNFCFSPYPLVHGSSPFKRAKLSESPKLVLIDEEQSNSEGPL